MSITHFPNEQFTHQATYDVPIIRMGSFNGSWWAASKIYRNWATQQFWCENSKISQRTDIPFWYKNTHLWENCWVFDKDDLHGEHPLGTDYTKSHDHFNDQTLMIHLYNWHKRDFDEGFGDYFPPRNKNTTTYQDGEECLQDIVNLFHSNNAKVIPYVNARYVNQDTPWYVTYGNNNALRDENGNVIIYPGNNDLTEICPFSPAWENELIDICVELAHYGVDGIYLDTLCSYFKCYDTNHGHAACGSSEYAQECRDWIIDIRSAVNQAFANDGYPDKKIMLTGEHYAEWAIGVLDSGLNCEFTQPDIPLFNSVYHDYLIIWGNIINPTYPDNWGQENMLPWIHAVPAYSFIYGDQIGWYRQLYRSDYMSKCAKMRALSDVYKYLVTGEMVEPPYFTNNPGTFTTPNWNGDAGDFVLPVVLHSAWKAEDGTVGLVFANLSKDSTKSVSYKFNATAYGLTGPNITITSITTQGRVVIGTYSAGSLLTTGRTEQIPAEGLLVLEFKN